MQVRQHSKMNFWTLFWRPPSSQKRQRYSLHKERGTKQTSNLNLPTGLRSPCSFYSPIWRRLRDFHWNLRAFHVVRYLWVLTGERTFRRLSLHSQRLRTRRTGGISRPPRIQPEQPIRQLQTSLSHR